MGDITMPKTFAVLLVCFFLPVLAQSAEPILRVGAQRISRPDHAVTLVNPQVATYDSLFPISGVADANLLCQAFGFAGEYFVEGDSSTYIERTSYTSFGGPAMFLFANGHAQLSQNDTDFISRVTCAK